MTLTHTYADKLPASIKWENNSLFMLDQTLLPNEIVMEEHKTVEEVYDSILKLKVRGAPAIGIAGAYGLIVAIRDSLALSSEAFQQLIIEKADYLDSSRPTAVNLHWALSRMKAVAASHKELEPALLLEKLTKEAIAIHEEDKALNYAIGQAGLPLIKPNMGILTHCNAGSLATSILGTALAPMYLAHAADIPFRVYADETRPLLQGARLTSWELQQAGIDVTLICDNMAASMMKEGLIDMVIVGTDRVAKNGDTANKIGTLNVAILAKYFDIPFYVALPSSTFDFDCHHGDEIPIEERESEEVTSFGLRRTGPENIKTRNPAFDVTSHELITGFITEKGLIKPPFDVNLEKII